MSEIVENKPKINITAEKPVPVIIKPRFVKIQVSGYKPFFAGFDGDVSVIEKAFLDSFGVELERKESGTREVLEEKPKKRGRKPKAEATA